MNEVTSCLTEVSNIFSVKEVSEVLRVGKNKIYQMLELGVLNGFKIGKLWRVRSSDIDDYINKHYSRCG